MTKKNKRKLSKNAAHAQTESLPQTQKTSQFPALGHQLVVARPKAAAGVDTDGWVRVKPSGRQRVRQFFMAYLQGFAFALIALACLYLPDFALDYAHRGEHFLHFFAGFFFAAVGLVAVCAAINTLIRDTVCHIHPESGRLVCASKLTNERIAGAIDIKSVPVLEILPPGMLLRRTRIITLYHEMECVVADTSGDDADIKALYQWLREIRSQSAEDK